MKSSCTNNHSFALSFLTIALTQAVYAAEEIPVLDEVVVSGSRTETKLSDTPMSIGVVDNKTLKRDKPKSIGDAINRIAGVNWVDLGNEQHMMGIRQPNSTNAVYQYLEDGIPIRPLGVFNHNALNEINLAGAERVEVIKGASSSLYGSNAVGGAVNFITARPSLTPEANVGFRNEAVTGYQRIDTGASNTWGDLSTRQPEVQAALESLFAERVGSSELAALKEGFRRANPGQMEENIADKIMPRFSGLLREEKTLGKDEVAQLKGVDFLAVLFERLQATEIVTDNHLQALAQMRGKHVIEALRASGVVADRLKELLPEKGASADGEIPVRLVLEAVKN